MKKSPISAVVLTRNSIQTLKRCLSSLSFCDEILIIDDESTDTTRDVARSMGASVHTHRLNGDFASQRNFAITKARNEWVLFIDSDEEVSGELRSAVTSAVQSGRLGGYYLRRRDYWWGRELKYGETMKVRNSGLLRLVRSGSGRWQGKVHEVFTTDRPTGRLDGFINHYPHQSLFEFIHEINTYSSLRAAELYDRGDRAGVWQVLMYPFAKFLVTYVGRLGFLDGPPGFAYAFLMSFHSYLVRAKLYQYGAFGRP